MMKPSQVNRIMRSLEHSRDQLNAELDTLRNWNPKGAETFVDHLKAAKKWVHSLDTLVECLLIEEEKP